MGVIDARMIAGTRLAAYGHGDWNDSLQPADPSFRDRLCSAWTVTLHCQTLTTLAEALRRLGRDQQAERFEQEAAEVLADFQRLLMKDGTLAGYVHFGEAGGVQYLLHPDDRITGLSYSLLPMIHAILNGMFSREQASHHLRLIETHLLGPDGARLFDRPMEYRGGPQQLFQRAESSSFFGREIGLMYTHAHLRYAEALWHYGDADGFFRALCQAVPIGLGDRVPAATTASGQLLLLQQRRRLCRSLSGLCRIRTRARRIHSARRRLADLLERRGHRNGADLPLLPRAAGGAGHAS